MQGRLVPKYRGRYQAHPKGYWRAEFDVAGTEGLELIEFILDYEDAAENPLLADPDSVRRAAAETGVQVRSICADYFMAAPLQRDDDGHDVLARLLDNATTIGVRDIVIPCVDRSSLATAAETEAFVTALRPHADHAGRAGVNLALETDLAPGPFADLLAAIGHPAVTVNYDSGNSAALGFDAAEEFAAYGARISDIHIKDRTRGGGPVVLGEGDCDFDLVFGLIAASTFDGPLVMQAYRDDEGVAVFRRQKAWLDERYGEALQ